MSVSQMVHWIGLTSAVDVSLACLFPSLAGTNSQGPEEDAVLSQEVHGKNDLLAIASFLVHIAVTVHVSPFCSLPLQIVRTMPFS